MKNENVSQRSSSSKFAVRSTTKNSTRNKTKEIENIMKKIENNEHLLKLERKKQKEIKTNFDKQLTKISQSKLTLETELDNALKELNEKEAQIYNIQKNNVEKFKNEIFKYDSIHKELLKRNDEMSKVIDEIASKENSLNDKAKKINEDISAQENELSSLKQKINDTIEELKQIEATTPNEFNFLKEDFQLQKELSGLNYNFNINNEKIKEDTKIIKENNKTKDVYSEQAKVLKEEMKENSDRAESENKNESFAKLEEHIVKNIDDLYLWNYLKEIMIDYYNEKLFDGDNGDYITGLGAIWEKKVNALQLDYINNKKSMDGQIEVLIKRIDEVEHKTQNSNDVNELSILQSNLQKINDNKDNFNVCYGKVFDLFNLYNTLLTKVQNDNESNLFEENFVDQASKMHITLNELNEEDRKSFIKLLGVYLTELSSKTKITKLLSIKEEKMNNQLSDINMNIEEIDINNETYEKEINELRERNAKISKKIKNLKDTIMIRNKTLRSKLEKISNEQFNSYLQLNQTVLKNMGKIYGNKIVSKVNKVQKEKMYENIITSHNEKKEKINQCIMFISGFETKNEAIQNEIKRLTEEYEKINEEIQKVVIEKEKKKKEKKILEESEKELKDKIDMILIQQEKNIKEEKNKLRKKFNVNYFIEKTKEINSKLTQLDEDKQKILSQIEAFNIEFTQREKQLHLDDLNLKNSLVFLKLDLPEEHQSPAITMLPFHSEKKMNAANESIPSIQNKIKSSLDKFTVLNPEEESKLNEYNNTITVTNVSENRLLYEKIKPIVNGICAYKKYSNDTSLMNEKEFDPFDIKASPEKSGYGLRMFRLSQTFTAIDIYQVNSDETANEKKREKEIKIDEVIDLRLTVKGNKIVKEEEKRRKQGNDELMIRNEYVPCMLIIKGGKIDIICRSYEEFIEMNNAIKEIAENKKKMNVIKDTIEEIEKQNDNIMIIS